MPRTLALFGSLVFLALLVLPLAPAQIHGVPPSVTSFGFGGNMSRTPGVPASVTSLGPHGFGDTRPIYGGRWFRNCCYFSDSDGFHWNSRTSSRHRDHRRAFGYGSLYYPAYSGYSEVVVVPPDEAYDEDELAYDPRVLRLRLPEETEVAARPKSAPEAVPAAPAPEPVVAQPTTVLVFKDGHKTEVQNYAIVGATLFELGDGRTRKIPLADLDLSATAKANDDLGVDFRLPAGSK